MRIFIKNTRRIFLGALLFLGLTGFLFMACDSPNAPDCIQAAGPVESYALEVPEFDRITVFPGITLILAQSDAQKVTVETGKNLRDEISAVVEGGRLILRNSEGCNLVRKYGLTKVYISVPRLVEVRSSSGQPIRSEGVLAFPNLTLNCEAFNVPEADTTDGEFDLEIQAQSLSITVNGIAYFKLSGQVERLNLNIAAGDTRIEAQELRADVVSLNHRGTNDLLIYPVTLVSGVIRSTGDVRSYNRPEVVDVQELYRGKLIFME